MGTSSATGASLTFSSSDIFEDKAQNRNEREGSGNARCNLIASGYTAHVYRIPREKKIIKSFFAENRTSHFRVEKDVYERFWSKSGLRSPPQSILRYYGSCATVQKSHSSAEGEGEKAEERSANGKVEDDGALILDLAERGSLYDQMYHAAVGVPGTAFPRDPIRGPQSKLVCPRPPIWLLFRWTYQILSALAYAHSLNILHSDIHISNFVLDERFNLKVADWAGASIEGSVSQSYYRLTHRLFTRTRINQGAEEEGGEANVHMREGNGEGEVEKGRASKSDAEVDSDTTDKREWADYDTIGSNITLASEVFAVGSALFNLVTGHDLWEGQLEYGRDREEIIRRIRARRFPGTTTSCCCGDPGSGDGGVCGEECTDGDRMEVFGKIISGCWNLDFKGTEEVKEAVEAAERRWRLATGKADVATDMHGVVP